MATMVTLDSDKADRILAAFREHDVQRHGVIGRAHLEAMLGLVVKPPLADSEVLELSGLLDSFTSTATQGVDYERFVQWLYSPPSQASSEEEPPGCQQLTLLRPRPPPSSGAQPTFTRSRSLANGGNNKARGSRGSGTSGSPRELLDRLREDESWEIRRDSAEALPGVLGADASTGERAAAAAALQHSLEVEKDSAVLLAAAGALAQVLGADAETGERAAALAALHGRSAGDEDLELRGAAAIAFEKVSAAAEEKPLKDLECLNGVWYHIVGFPIGELTDGVFVWDESLRQALEKQEDRQVRTAKLCIAADGKLELEAGGTKRKASYCEGPPQFLRWIEGDYWFRKNQ